MWWHIDFFLLDPGIRRPLEIRSKEVVQAKQINSQ